MHLAINEKVQKLACSAHRVPQTKKCSDSVLHNITNASKALGPHGQETQLMEAAEDPGNDSLLCPERMEWGHPWKDFKLSYCI